MKLTTKQFRKLIRESIDDHITGIENKMARLNKFIDSEKDRVIRKYGLDAVDDPVDWIGGHIENLTDANAARKKWITRIWAAQDKIDDLEQELNSMGIELAEDEDESSKELRDFEGFGKDDEIANAIEDIKDALYLLGEEEPLPEGNLFHVINRLREAQFTLEELVPGLTQHV